MTVEIKDGIDELIFETVGDVVLSPREVELLSLAFYAGMMHMATMYAETADNTPDDWMKMPEGPAKIKAAISCINVLADRAQSVSRKIESLPALFMKHATALRLKDRRNARPN